MESESTKEGTVMADAVSSEEQSTVEEIAVAADSTTLEDVVQVSSSSGENCSASAGVSESNNDICAPTSTSDIKCNDSTSRPEPDRVNSADISSSDQNPESTADSITAGAVSAETDTGEEKFQDHQIDSSTNVSADQLNLPQCDSSVDKGADCDPNNLEEASQNLGSEPTDVCEKPNPGDTDIDVKSDVHDQENVPYSELNNEVSSSSPKTPDPVAGVEEASSDNKSPDDNCAGVGEVGAEEVSAELQVSEPCEIVPEIKVEADLGEAHDVDEHSSEQDEVFHDTQGDVGHDLDSAKQDCHQKDEDYDTVEEDYGDANDYSGDDYVVEKEFYEVDGEEEGAEQEEEVHFILLHHCFSVWNFNLISICRVLGYSGTAETGCENPEFVNCKCYQIIVQAW